MDIQENKEEHEINLLQLFQVIVRRKMLIFSICAIASVVSAGYSLTLPNKYAATAKVLPPQKEGGGGLSSLLGQAGGLAGLAAGGLGGGSDLYLGILKSRSVADAVIKRLDLVRVFRAEDVEAARITLGGAIKANIGKDGIMLITAEDKDPKLAALLANTAVDELAKTTIRLNLTKAGNERLFLEKRLEVVKRDLKAAEEDLKSFAQSNQVVQPEAQAQASLGALSRMKAELASKEVQLSTLLTGQTEQSPEVKKLRAGMQRLRGEIAQIAGKGGGGEGIPSVGNVPDVGLQYSRKMRELKTQEAVYEQLMKQYEVAKLGEAKDSSSLQVLDEAVVPAKKAGPMRSRIVIFAALAAFLFSLFLVFALEYFEHMAEEDRMLLRTIKKQMLSWK